MSDIERIHALRDAGHITAEEAERLIGVLVALDEPAESAGTDDSSAADGNAATSAAVGSDASDAATSAVEAETGARGAGAVGRDRSAPSGGTTRADPPPIDLASAGTRWCTVELTASGLTVMADDVAEPQVEADEAQQIVVTPTDGGLRVTARRGSKVDRWVGRPHALKTSIRLPRGWGVELDVKAGNASVRDVPYVRGRMVAGNLDVHGAEAVDVAMSAGDLSVAFCPSHGRHRIAAKAGDVAVRFLPGSDATIEASASMGRLDVPGGFDVQRRVVGAHARGRVGAGTAHVELRVAAGDLSVSAPPEAA
jgi:hypothetical protein